MSENKPKRETKTIALKDFMDLPDAEEAVYKQLPDSAYLAALSTKEARNAASIAAELEVTAYTVQRRLKKLEGQFLVRYDGTEAFYAAKVIE